MALKINPLQRQPNNLDFASPTQFRFNLLKVPNVEFFVTSVNIPGINFTGDATMNTRFKSIAFMGDTIDFADLELTFLVNQDLSNYREIFDWMTGLGFPDSYEQRKAVNKNQPYSDASLIIMTAQYQPHIEVKFIDLYPTNLASLEFDISGSDIEYLTGDVTFTYRSYEISTIA